MKIAVIFLCLAVASFIDTSKGNDIKLNPLEKDKIDNYARDMYTIAEKVKSLETCPESEKWTRQLCLVEDMMSELKFLSCDLGCSVNDLFKVIDMPLNVIEKLKVSDIEAVLQQINVEVLIKSVFNLVEGAMAQVGCVLKTEILELNKLLGSVNGLPLMVSQLHSTMGGIVTSMKGSPLASALDLPTVPVLSNILKGGLLG